MKFHRIYAILLRHLYMLRRSYEHIINLFYWITLDLLLWGITASYFQQFTPDAKSVIFMIVSGVLLWNVTHRTQLEINIGILEELWNKNLINIFVSPLQIKEYVSGLVILSIVKTLASLTFGSFVAYFLYKTSILIYSFNILLFIFLLTLSGIWIGFIVGSLLVRFGTRAEILSWSLIWIFSPFSAVYYPLDILPSWAQTVSRLLPMSYIFEQARSLLFHGTIDYTQLVLSFVLSLLYIMLSIFLFYTAFRKVLQKGLVKLY